MRGGRSDAPTAPQNVLLVAGGTGGHILPAIAFGSWIHKNREGVSVRYMCGSRPLEREIYTAFGIEAFSVSLSGSPMGASWLRGIRRVAEMWRAYRQSADYMRRESFDLCVLFGGYLSVAPMLICRARGIRAAFHEQNAAAGRGTKLAHRLAIPVATGWETCSPLVPGSFTPTGTPIRAFETMGREDAWQALGLPGQAAQGPIVSVMTGSLGSAAVAATIAHTAGLERFRSWCFLTLTPEVRAPERAAQNLIRVPITWNVSPLYSLSDIAIVRGGASTLSEISAAGIPAVVIPWRASAGDHQTANARALAEAPHIRIWDERSRQVDELANHLEELHISYPARSGDMGKRLYNASESICEKLWDFATAQEGRGSCWRQARPSSI